MRRFSRGHVEKSSIKQTRLVYEAAIWGVSHVLTLPSYIRMCLGIESVLGNLDLISIRLVGSESEYSPLDGHPDLVPTTSKMLRDRRRLEIVQPFLL